MHGLSHTPIMLKVEPQGSILHITLDRPEVKNAFNDELIAQLSEVFTLVAPSYRVAILRGSGTAFSAGGDLQWMKKAADCSERENYEDALKLAWLFASIANSRIPVISLVNGPAFGGGCGLVAASDIAIGTEKSLFAFSEVKLGLIPATIAPHVISKIGQGAARRYFVTGEPFGGETALRIGLIHDLVASTELESYASKVVAHILKSGPEAIASAKRLTIEKTISIEESARKIANARASDEGREGVRAFLEKRPATFTEELPKE